MTVNKGTSAKGNIRVIILSGPNCWSVLIGYLVTSNVAKPLPACTQFVCSTEVIQTSAVMTIQLQHCRFIYDVHAKYWSYKKHCHKFRKNFLKHVPDTHTYRFKYVGRLRATAKQENKHYAHAEKKRNGRGATFEKSPIKSLFLLAPQMSMLHWHPHKTTVVQDLWHRSGGKSEFCELGTLCRTKIHRPKIF